MTCTVDVSSSCGLGLKWNLLTFVHNSLAQELPHHGHFGGGNRGDHFASFEDILR